MHLQKLVQFGHVEARAGGDAPLAAGLHQVGVGAFLLRHRIDERDLASQHQVVKACGFGRLLHLAHARKHAHQALHAAHLEHLVKLVPEVVHVEQTLGETLGHALRLFEFQGFLRLLDQRHDVAHAKNAAGDAFGLEGLDRVHLLAKADKADRLAGDGAHGQGRAAATVTVHPGEDDAGDADLAVEFGGDVHRVLAGQAVDDQKRLARGDGIADRLHLVHQDFVDVQASGSVEHVDVIAAERRLLFGAPGDLHRGFALDDGQGIDADLGAEDGKLFHRGGTVGVERRHQDALAVLFRQALGELRRRRRLA